MNLFARVFASYVTIPLFAAAFETGWGSLLLTGFCVFVPKLSISVSPNSFATNLASFSLAVSASRRETESFEKSLARISPSFLAPRSVILLLKYSILAALFSPLKSIVILPPLSTAGSASFSTEILHPLPKFAFSVQLHC